MTVDDLINPNYGIDGGFKTMKKNRSINISKILYEKIKEKIKDTSFNSVDSYVEYILNQVISEEDEPESLTEEEEEKVKERLVALGYL